MQKLAVHPDQNIVRDIDILKMKICIAGKNLIAVNAMRHLVDTIGAANVTACPNESDNGNSNWQPSLRKHAKELGIKTLSIEECYGIVDLRFISLEFDRIINPAKFKTGRLYNIHFSSLPSYKGMYTSAWPILNGELFSGVTLHQIDHGIDTGDIIDQANFRLEEKETARSLYYKYLDSGFVIFKKNLELIISGKHPKKPQRSENSSYFSKHSLDYTKLQIDVKKTASEIGRQIRAFTFLEYQIPEISGIPVGAFEISNERSTRPAGFVSEIHEDKFTLSTIDYDIIFNKCNAKEFLNSVNALDLEKIVSLLEKGVSPELTGFSGWTPLMIAAYHGHTRLCSELLKRKANPNARNQNGTTVLMYAKDAAEQLGDFSVCDLLIENGADPNAKDHFGKTALMYAEEKTQTASVSYFRKF